VRKDGFVRARSIAVNAPVAQLDRAPDYESGGQGFESLRVYHFQVYQPHPRGIFCFGVGMNRTSNHLFMKTTAWIFLTVLGMATIPAGGTPAIQEKRSFASLQESLQADRIVTYRTVGNRELSLHIFNPKDFESSGNAPAFVAIHGGGWTSGTPRRFYPYAHALVDKGYVGISVEYRLVGQKGVTVFDCVKDGRAAIRYIRAHAGELGIDPAMITVSGG
jgi:hypothetical protein